MESLSINYTLLIQILSFLLLVWLLNIIVFRPIRNLLNKRKEHISSEEDLIRTWGSNAERFSAELGSNISEAEKNGIKEKDALKSEGLKEEQKMLRETYSVIETRLNEARKDIDEKIRLAKGSLDTEINGFSTDLAEKILGRSI